VRESYRQNHLKQDVFTQPGPIVDNLQPAQQVGSVP